MSFSLHLASSNIQLDPKVHQSIAWKTVLGSSEYKEFLGCLTDIKSENLQFFILRHVYRKSVRNEELPQKCKVDIKLNSLREVRKSTFFSTLKHFLSLAFLCVFGAEICKIFWENAEIFGRNFWTVSWWDSNTLQKFFNFFENEKIFGVVLYFIPYKNF